MRKLSLIIVVLLAGNCLADSTIKLPDKVAGDIGDFIKVPATTDGTTVKWLALDKGIAVFPVDLLKDSKTAIVIAKAAGSYRIMAYTAKGDVPSDPSICTVVVSGDVPPAPTPTPNPAPTPPPASQKAWVVAVVDNSNRTQDVANVVGDIDGWKALEARGHDWRVLDVNDPLIAAKNYGSFVQQAGGAPAVIILSTSGKLLKAAKLPATTAALSDLVKQVTGQ